jgi:hypothetical protein
MPIITKQRRSVFRFIDDVESDCFQREDRHLVTDPDLERPDAKRTGPDSNLLQIIGNQVKLAA